MAQTYEIVIDNFQFPSEPTEIETGDSIVWINNDSDDHTATSTTPGIFDTNIISPGSQSDAVLFDEVSDSSVIDYFCQVHPGMTGKVIIFGEKTRGKVDINSMHPVDRAEFHALVIRYIDESKAVQEHIDIGDDAHGQNFLSWHRYFLAKFEHWLHQQGADKFIPCPTWNPKEQIPADFSQKPTTPANDLRTGDISSPLPLQFTLAGDGTKSILDYADYAELNDDVESYHDGVHGDIGGIMRTHQSPKDPIFWPFHSLLTLVYEVWLTR